MEPVTAQMPDMTMYAMCIVAVVLLVSFVAQTAKANRRHKPRRRSFEDAYLDKLSNTDF